MNRFIILLLSSCAALGADNVLTSDEKAAGWQLLFDGKTTAGWMTSDSKPPRTPVDQESLNPHKSGHYMLVHTQQWSDFALSLDFKISKGCNSGVFVRTSSLTPRPGKDVGYNGIEIAIDGTTGAGYHDTGAIYDLVKPRKNAMKPVGEWNHMVVTCDNNSIQVELNGEPVSSMNLDEFPAPNKRPDGTSHKFDTAWKDHPRKGYIGLQDHGSPCWFKNIKLREIRQRTATAPQNTNALLTAQDHQKMMDLLGIKSLRRGANPNNPDAPNAVNYDESKANPYPNLPDPFVLKSGAKVMDASTWWNRRRAEIVEDFDREIYGCVPKDVPNVKWEVTSKTETTNGTVPVVTKQLVGHVDNSAYPQITVDIQMTLTTPAEAKRPVPVMLEFGFLGFGTNIFGGTNRFARGTNRPATGPTWQQQVLAKGWGYAIISPSSIQADNGAGLTRGVIGLVNKGQPRKADDWGSLRAWAWGASRALDYFETDKSVDAKQVGIEGLSRYGKAALVAMAYDSRFAIGFIGSSGEGGAKLHRRNFGELVENLTASGEYHWMTGNFLKYGGPLNAGDLPVDAHELIALCAPRPIFISYGASEGPGAEGRWLDQKGSFMAAVAAGPVYRLLGKKDLGTSEFPPVETGLMDGELAFRQHSGGHTTGPNWPHFLTWADRYIVPQH